MTRLLLILLAVLQLHFASAQTSTHQPKPDTTLVSLAGKTATTIFINHTPDTLKFNATITHYLPVGEQSVAVVVPPGGQRTFALTLNYPDFIKLNTFPYSIYHAPGKTVTCVIENANPRSVTFTGDLKDENTYYHAYHQVERIDRVYYNAGATLSNFNNFPRLADSINRINLNFLSAYQGSLPQHFKQQEKERLQYYNAFLKYHVLFDKSARANQPIVVDNTYYSFEKTVPPVNDNALLSTEYLWYALFYLRRQALLKHPDDEQLKSNMLHEAARVYQNHPVGDAVKMRLLYDAYNYSPAEYQRLLSTTTFANANLRLITDSVAKALLGLPKTGQHAPAFRLLSSTGDTVSLPDFAGRPVIINFWAPWCAPCIKEFPAENRLTEKYSRPGGLVVINICVDATLPNWQRLSATHGLKMVNLYADANASAKLKKRYDLSALPKSVAIGKNQSITNSYLKRASQLTDEDIKAVSPPAP